LFKEHSLVEDALKTSAEVEKYLKRQKSPQQEITRRLRDITLKALPGINEEFKMGVPWYEGKFYVVALRDHVNMGFFGERLVRAGYGFV
jgi:hypothetical protein